MSMLDAINDTLKGYTLTEYLMSAIDTQSKMVAVFESGLGLFSQPFGDDGIIEIRKDSHRPFSFSILIHVDGSLHISSHNVYLEKSLVDTVIKLVQCLSKVEGLSTNLTVLKAQYGLVKYYRRALTGMMWVYENPLDFPYADRYSYVEMLNAHIFLREDDGDWSRVVSADGTIEFTGTRLLHTNGEASASVEVFVTLSIVLGVNGLTVKCWNYIRHWVTKTPLEAVLVSIPKPIPYNSHVTNQLVRDALQIFKEDNYSVSSD